MIYPFEATGSSIVTSSRSAQALGRALGLCALTLILSYAQRSSAQADTNPQMPNVLLLVDTSGSMEYKSSSNTFPACRYDSNGLVASPPAASEKSRWTDLVEVLTGSIVNYDCQTIDRGSLAFKNEYKVSGSNLATSPYDFLYSNPYHRPMSGGCVAGPGSLNPANKADFPANAFNYHTYNNTASSCTFLQQPDGILDSFQSLVRFGLMTFDTDPSPDQGEIGNYSYVIGNSHTGLPAGCTTPQAMEVGARNASAPPWEGRLIPFGDPAPGSLDYATKNQQIQQVLRATRPYGATPIAGMMSDARDFLRLDSSSDPVDSSKPFGPKDDPYASCRDTMLLLLSDGQPNMDLRGHCNGSDCPFQLPEQVAADLLTQSAPRRPVKTFVIGFALNSLTVGGSTIDCSKITDKDLDAASPSALCTANPDNPQLQACCNLARIAVAGDSSSNHHAYFANNRSELQSDIDLIVKANLTQSSRTQPAFGLGTGSGAGNGGSAASYRFFSDFIPGGAQLWTGEVKRERWMCDATSHVASAIAPDPNAGDLFADNLNTQSPPRSFYTVQVTASGGSVYSDRTVRPNLTTNPDGVGALTGTVTTGNAAAFVSNTSAASMGLTDTSCVDTVNGVTVTLTAAQCRDRYLKWLVGIDNGTVFTRCPVGQCSLLGDIFHSTPKVVPPPSEFTRDDSYQAFQDLYAARPLMLYTSSNDGFLHAFKVASNVKDDPLDVKSKKNNELWAFMPPQVLPHVSSEYPFTHQLLLDGRPVVKDVVARKVTGTYPYVFERSLADASASLSPNVTWRTILVQSFGGTYPGYFALDVTDPVPSATGGPKFLWQLETDSAGNRLFGDGGGTPLITTVYFRGKEVAVAILPGGYAKDPGFAGANNGCARANTNFSDLTVNGAPTPRTRVPCYTDAASLARSLTVVRLDSGEILRTFRRSENEVPGLVGKNVTTKANLDSPMTGQPVAYPADVGAVADRVFIGDQDGALWRLNFASKTGEPEDWVLDLFFDGFPAATPDFGHTWNQGQPITAAPVISVDRIGNLTVAFSTGDQEAIGALSGLSNYVWSLTEQPSADRTKLAPKVNWNLGLKGSLSGDRVIGEMALFSGDLFFSTVGPDQQNDACSSGSGKVWGMNYLDPNPAGAGKGGKLSTTFTSLVGSGGYIDATTLLGTDARGFLSGVSVTQQPTCESVSSAADDGFFAYGVKPSGSPPSAGKYQLVIPTGDKVSTTTKTGITPITSGSTNGVAIDLKPPALSLVVDSWAAVVE